MKTVGEQQRLAPLIVRTTYAWQYVWGTKRTT